MFPFLFENKNLFLDTGIPCWGRYHPVSKKRFFLALSYSICRVVTVRFY